MIRERTPEEKLSLMISRVAALEGYNRTQNEQISMLMGRVRELDERVECLRESRSEALSAAALPNGPERRQSLTHPGLMTFTTMRGN